MMICHYQYGRDSSWRPTHLQKANFFQDDEGKLAVQAKKHFHGKTYLKQDANTNFFSAVQMVHVIFLPRIRLNFWESDICPVIDVDDIFTWLMFSCDSKIEIGKLSWCVVCLHVTLSQECFCFLMWMQSSWYCAHALKIFSLFANTKLVLQNRMNSNQLLVPQIPRHYDVSETRLNQQDFNFNHQFATQKMHPMAGPHGPHSHG